MAKGNTHENDYLLHLFNNVAITLVGDAGGLLPAITIGNFYLGLCTADPGEAGTQTTNEATYTGYARVAIPRTVGGFTVTNNLVTNAAAITFAQCTGGNNVITHWILGCSLAGAGKLLYKGSIGTSVQGPFTATVADVITIPSHTLVVDDRCTFYPALESSLPTGITEGTVYWVKTVSGNDITISTTQGGGTLDITVAGDGVVYKAATLTVSALITPEVGVGQLNITED